MKNQKVGTITGVVVLVIISVTAFVFVWTYEQSLGAAMQPSVSISKPMKTTNSQKSVKNETVIMEDDDLQHVTSTNLCEGFSEEPGIGESYPIAEKYSHLAFLGELFTASDCSAERVLEINQGSAERKNGIRLLLKTVPSDKFRVVLENVGFSCENNQTASCTEWDFERPIKLQELLKLKPFADEISVDDCIICG